MQIRNKKIDTEYPSPKIKEATIYCARLLNEDNGYMTLDIWFEYNRYEEIYIYNVSSIIGQCIEKCMDICGVGEFSQVRGSKVRIKLSQGRIYAFGHIVDDKWFYPKQVQILK